MTGESSPSIVIAPGSNAVPCTVCTILIGSGYYEDRIHRDPVTGWRVCGACLASLRRQRQRDGERPRGQGR